MNKKIGIFITYMVMGVLFAGALVGGLFRTVSFAKGETKRTEKRDIRSILLCGDYTDSKQVHDRLMTIVYPYIEEYGYIDSALVPSRSESNKVDSSADSENQYVTSLPFDNAKEQVIVPDVIGQSELQANNTLLIRGLQGNVSAYLFSEEYEEGTVITQFPEAGESVDKDTAVILVMSKGRKDAASDSKVSNISESESVSDLSETQAIDIRNISLQEIYDLLTNCYDVQDIKDRISTNPVVDTDTTLMYTGGLGTEICKGKEELMGYISYSADLPVYGIYDENQNYRCWSWTSNAGTDCLDDILVDLYNLQYITSGYHNKSTVTIYDWENKLTISVLQSGDDANKQTIVQCILYDDCRGIYFW